MARARRHKHHSRKSRSNWAVMGAFVASAAFAPHARRARARRGARRAGSSRCGSRCPARRGSRARCAAAGAAPATSVRCVSTFPPARCAHVLAEIERISGREHRASRIAAIADISSAGVSRPLHADGSDRARARGHERDVARHRAEQRVARDSPRVRSGRRDRRAFRSRAPSSPKYAQPLIEVPQTIEVIPREVMEAQGVTTLSEALRNVPGISLQAGEGRRRVEHVGRHVQPARLQRQQQPLRRRRPRRRVDVARRLQPRADRSVHGPDRIGCRPRQRGRLREHADQGAARGVRLRRELRLRQRRSEPHDGRSQSGAHARCAGQLARPQRGAR